MSLSRAIRLALRYQATPWGLYAFHQWWRE